ncbi:hypothetical protein LB559_26500 [Mesorhizobium sp. BR1-1-3]|uniref:hypothetical protein n=1 Tax=Mesorhizobium sp. BR1-1-3 TaxID=2876651 RepID=UPI001CD165D0|nr:hypothetical protein [Mesorhizobium sp. BR1-1-3]MBZ9891482.1 hypothetical protein [Mesorhizobium sp. BR1-1-3]
MLAKDAVICWTPDRPPFHDRPMAGTIMVTTAPLPQHDYGHVKTYGAVNLDWRQMDAYDRRQKLQRLFTQIIHKDCVPEIDARLALSVIDDVLIDDLHSQQQDEDEV